MATIPLYNGGAIPANPTGVRVPIVGQGVTAGPSGGQALVKVGELGTQLAAHMRAADDSRGLLDAAGIQSNYAAKQQLFQEQNQDQNTWLPQWQKHQEQMQEELGKLDLSSSARKTLDISTNRWTEGQAITIQGQAAKQSGNRAVQAADNMMGALAKVGDRQGILKVEPIIPDAVMPPEAKTAFVNRHLQVADDVIRGKEFNSLMQVAKTNPDLIKAGPESLASAKRAAGTLDERQEYLLHEAAAGQIQRNRAVLLKNWSDRTSIGNPPTEAELKSAQYATDLDKQMIIHQAMSIPQNDPAKYEKYTALISNYDPAKDLTGLKRAQIETAMTGDFGGAYLDGLKNLMAEKAKPKDPTKIDEGPALELLNSWTEGGGLGNYKTPVLGTDGKPTFKEKKGEYSFDPEKGFSWFGLAKEGGYSQGENTYEPQFIEDPVKKSGATSKQSEIRLKLLNEIKAGKFKFTEEVTPRMLQLFQEAGGIAPTPVNPLLPAADWKAAPTAPNDADEGVQKTLKILNK